MAFLFLIAPSAASARQLTLEGRQFLLDGKLWVAKGVKVEVFNRPAYLRVNPDTPPWLRNHPEHREWWGPAEMKAARSVFGANTIRFAISQPGLDPQSPIYDATYETELLRVVGEARAAGFVVIVSMDDQDENGLVNQPCMPGDGAVRAWRNFAPKLSHDADVMFEIFDEPCQPSTGPARLAWAQSMQPIVDAIRGAKAPNILLLDGLWWARVTYGLSGLVHDPMPNRIAWAIHPYLLDAPNVYANVAQWRAAFGNDASSNPMIATEWNATPKAGCAGSETPAQSEALLRYLATLRIGLIGWAIDTEQPTLVKDHDGFAPTDFSSFSDCKDGSNSGGGKLLAAYPLQ